ncbi:MAG: 5-methyltetrahydropteroyltriglutamate--homocysteine S-methyltransferase [Candidatus Omnitrophota bacterium]|nr:5-methyltetrahydropteroyltriglutamate--homocysteine S-methyltransferase [Candidatus Omnitrophota bacterium]
MKTYAYGFPRLGKNREFKTAVESFWKGNLSEADTKKALDDIQSNMLALYEQNVDNFPIGEITGYDNMLDTAIMVGLYQPKNLKEYYELCRGKDALEMTKWFNTNYHYLVPNFSLIKNPKFSFTANKSSAYYKQFKKGLPFLIGPFTFLKLSKGIPANKFNDYLLQLAEVYKTILNDLPQVHIEEPALVMDLTSTEIAAFKQAYKIIGASKSKINLITYYDSVDCLKELYDLPVSAIGLDFANGKNNLEIIKKAGFPKDKTLIAGVVNGRNVWRNDIGSSVKLLDALAKIASSLVISNGAPLYHLPISLEGEKLDAALTQKLAFAKEKIQEVKTIAKAFETKKIPLMVAEKDFGVNKAVQKAVKALTDKDFVKAVSFEKRKALQKKLLNLPLFPTTTIGSFPQTEEVRRQRADFRSGKITEKQYNAFVQTKIQDVIKFQEELGLDVLVHGEFERTDMVEFFAQELDGIATTKAGWIISYGTRVYRPPMIYGDISRPKPMTVKEIAYAQTLTQKPVKGMLTGPVTIIAWSFVREDVPISDVAYQLGLALRDEIFDYEKAGIKIVQVDEPAIREKAPIKRKDWPQYFDWAIKSFRLATNTDPKTQIHTHMCYSEFGEIVGQIDQMDFDVISIETTRSKGDIIESFEKIDFKKQIGLGVWDIHSPAVPNVEDMREVVKRALKVIPKENFWINPDCGLKTRKWEETRATLKNLVTLSDELVKNS